MSGYTSSRSGRNKRSYRNYNCPKHLKKNGGTCSTKDINADYLENVVKSVITESINRYLQDKTAAKNVLSCLTAPLQEKRGRYSRRASDLDREINRLISLAANTTSDKLVKQYERKAEECVDTQDSLKVKIAEIDAQIDTMKAMTADMVHSNSLTPEDIFTSNERARELIDLFIERINIDEENDDIEILFRQ